MPGGSPPADYKPDSKPGYEEEQYNSKKEEEHYASKKEEEEKEEYGSEEEEKYDSDDKAPAPMPSPHSYTKRTTKHKGSSKKYHYKHSKN